MAEPHSGEPQPPPDTWVGVGVLGIVAALVASVLVYALWPPAAGHDVAWPERGLRLLFGLLVWAVLTWLFVRTGR
jgi:hypothetical protein